MAEERVRQLVSPDRARSRGVLEELLAAARAVGDADGEAVLLQRLAQLEFSTGNVQGADELYRQAGEKAREAGDAIGAARALQGRGDVASARGRFEEALAAYCGALEALEAEGDAAGARSCRLGSAQCLVALGQPDEAEGLLLTLCAEIDAEYEPGLACDCVTALGEIAEEREDAATACERYREALELAEASGDRMRLANGCGRLAGALLAAGIAPEAAEWAGQARALHQALGAVDLEALDLWNLGDALLAQGKAREARTALREAQLAYEVCGMAPQVAAIAEQLATLSTDMREELPPTA